MKLKFCKLLFFCCALAAGLVQTAFAQDETERIVLKRAEVPTTARQLKEFAPKNWKIVDQKTGDLNGDKLPDAALQIAPLASETELALVVAFKTANGYELAAVAPDALRCDCGSALGDGTPPVKIERGQILLEGLSGSRDTREITMRFRWDAGAKRFVLIGEDYQTSDRAAGGTRAASSNYLTNQQILTVSEPGKRDRRKQQKISGKTVYLDELDYESYAEKLEQSFENNTFLWQ